MKTADTAREMTGADALVGTLAGCGVTHVFANPGTSELDLVLALDREPRIRSVPVLFEGVASGAADGFARTCGRPAATLLHLGPGYLNAAANLHNARRARSPIINIVGDHAVGHRALDAPLTSDIAALAAPHSCWMRDVTTAAAMGEAAAEVVAMSRARRGPATLLVPADSAWSTGGVVAAPIERPSAGMPDARALAAAVDAVRAAKAPVIFVGGKVLGADGLGACARLAAAGWRVVHEFFPARHARGGGRFAPERLAYFAEAGLAQLGETDFMLTVGAKAPVGYFAYPNRPSTHVPATCTTRALVGPEEDEELAIFALADALGAPPGRIVAAGAPVPAPIGPLTTSAIAASIARHMPENAIVSDDGVTMSGPILAATQNSAPHDWMCLTGGALGQGLPLAVGAALAAPDRRVIALTGDGAMMYTLQALWTIARLQSSVTVVVAANRSYQILRVELARMGITSVGHTAGALIDLSNPSISFCALAQSLGVQAWRCEDAGTFDDIFLEASNTRGPSLIEAVLT